MDNFIKVLGLRGGLLGKAGIDTPYTNLVKELKKNLSSG
jgi:hypothetical protein